MQTSVVIVKPGGTGSPMRHISARFAPLPPSSGFIVPLPSVFLPKRYTCLPALAAAGLADLVVPFVVRVSAFLALPDFFAAFFAIGCLLPTPDPRRQSPRCQQVSKSILQVVSRDGAAPWSAPRCPS